MVQIADDVVNAQGKMYYMKENKGFFEGKKYKPHMPWDTN